MFGCGEILWQVIAELIGTYFVIFGGCGAVVVNKIYGSVTFPGICVVWGLIVMVMVYSVGHVSGAHFNPAVTLTFALFRRFPFWQVSLFFTLHTSFSLSFYCKPIVRTRTSRIHLWEVHTMVFKLYHWVRVKSGVVKKLTKINVVF